MFTLLAFSDSVDNAGILTPITAVVDQHVTVQGNFIYVPAFANKLMGAKAMCGASATHVRLRSPSISRLNPVEIKPITLDIINAGNDLFDIKQYGQLALDVDEGLSLEHDGNPALAEQTTALVWLSDGKVDAIGGEMHSVRAQITLALAPEQWNPSEIVLIDELPVGQYSLVGLRVECSVGVAFRVVFKGTQLFRPGAPCELAINNEQQWGIFRRGNLGNWGDFDSRSLPGIEVLGNAVVVSATYEIIMDLIKK